MEIQTLGCLKLSTTFPTMSWLSSISILKLEAFGCAKKNSSGPMLRNIQCHLNLTYLNNDEHTHLERAEGSILDMAFISPNLTKDDIQFLIGDNVGSDHLPIEISIDAQPHKDIHTNPVRYKFDQTDREVFETTLEVALSSSDIPKLKSTQDIDKYADFIVTAISTTVDKAIQTSKSGRPESQPVLDETLALIKEERRLRRQHSQAHDPLVKTSINQLQKEIKGAVGSADLKISKSALLSLNHHNFSNTKPIYTE